MDTLSTIFKIDNARCNEIHEIIQKIIKKDPLIAISSRAIFNDSRLKEAEKIMALLGLGMDIQKHAVPKFIAS